MNQEFKRLLTADEIKQEIIDPDPEFEYGVGPKSSSSTSLNSGDVATGVRNISLKRSSSTASIEPEKKRSRVDETQDSQLLNNGSGQGGSYKTPNIFKLRAEDERKAAEAKRPKFSPEEQAMIDRFLNVGIIDSKKWKEKMPLPREGISQADSEELGNHILQWQQGRIQKEFLFYIILVMCFEKYGIRRERLPRIVYKNPKILQPLIPIIDFKRLFIMGELHAKSLKDLISDGHPSFQSLKDHDPTYLTEYQKFEMSSYENFTEIIANQPVGIYQALLYFNLIKTWSKM